MPNRDEQQKKKEILHQLRMKAKEEFQNSLPMGRGYFEKLFDFLDSELQDKNCDDTTALTQSFLVNNGITNIHQVLDWLAENGGYCDCEILANVEERFE